MGVWGGEGEVGGLGWQRAADAITGIGPRNFTLLLVRASPIEAHHLACCWHGLTGQAVLRCSAVASLTKPPSRCTLLQACTGAKPKPKREPREAGVRQEDALAVSAAGSMGPLYGLGWRSGNLV